MLPLLRYLQPLPPPSKVNTSGKGEGRDVGARVQGALLGCPRSTSSGLQELAGFGCSLRGRRGAQVCAPSPVRCALVVWLGPAEKRATRRCQDILETPVVTGVPGRSCVPPHSSHRWSLLSVSFLLFPFPEEARVLCLLGFPRRGGASSPAPWNKPSNRDQCSKCSVGRQTRVHRHWPFRTGKEAKVAKNPAWGQALEPVWA